MQRHSDLHALAWVRNQAARDLDVHSTFGLAVGLALRANLLAPGAPLCKYHDAFRLSRPKGVLRSSCRFTGHPETIRVSCRTIYATANLGRALLQALSKKSQYPLSILKHCVIFTCHSAFVLRNLYISLRVFLGRPPKALRRRPT